MGTDSKTQPSKLSRTLAIIMLTCLSSLSLVVIAKLGNNKIWFEKVYSYWDDYLTQKNSDATIEQIREERLGPSYKMVREIKKYFDRKNIKNPVILFEPNSYLEQVVGLKMPEPVIFYYYTGMKSLWMNNKNLNEATHFIYFNKGQMHIDTIASKTMLEQILTTYKAYPQKL